MSNITIAGIDNSISSPAITIMELDEKSFSIVRYNYLNLFKTKKMFVKDHILEIPKHKNDIDRIITKNNIIIDFINSNKVLYCAIEDYSFASKGLVYNIAENTGYLKTQLYLSNINIRLYEPTSIKMFYNGKGNADKEAMIKTYKKNNNFLNLEDKTLNEQKPLEDIVDSFAVCSLLRTELMLRKGLINMKDLSENVIRVFNTIHKDTKTNILNTDFINNNNNN